MIYPSIDNLLTKVSSKYVLVNVAAKRAREMNETGHYQMKDSEYLTKKNLSKALEEIIKDLIIIK